MRMTIDRMTISNFKGIRELSIDFGDVTRISGMNGTGKTTIPDAFSWVLWNKDSRGNAPGSYDFREKPLDENGDEIHNLDTTVELFCKLDGQPFNLRRTQRENWVKKRGSAESVYQGNISTYWINDVETKLTDFKARISQITSEEVFRKTGRIFVPVASSARHVHLCHADVERLFGPGHQLTVFRMLSQPGQYLSNERVTVIGPKGEFGNVAVLGPERKEAQVEISLTDARTLGIDAPVRLSGDVAGSPGGVIVGQCGRVTLPQGVIVAKRHIHLTPEDAARFGVRDKQTVKLKAYTSRPVIFEDVAVRVSPEFASYVHLDYDEANACGFRKGDLGRILP